MKITLGFPTEALPKIEASPEAYAALSLSLLCLSVSVSRFQSLTLSRTHAVHISSLSLSSLGFYSRARSFSQGFRLLPLEPFTGSHPLVSISFPVLLLNRIEHYSDCICLSLSLTLLSSSLLPFPLHNPEQFIRNDAVAGGFLLTYQAYCNFCGSKPRYVPSLTLAERIRDREREGGRRR